MISFKRTKKRNYRNPSRKYMLISIAGAFLLLIGLTIAASSGKNNLNIHLIDTREMMAASIQRDMNQALQAGNTIEHRNVDLAGSLLPTMKQHMYAANAMNDVLIDAFGEEYSMMDPTQYEQFQTIMNQFDQLIATGQSTESAKADLIACMESLQASLVNRFTADGGLLPRTAMSSAQP